MKKTVILTILFAIPCPGYCTEGDVKTFPAAKIKNISIDTGAGGIAVAGGAKDEIRVEVTDNDPACVITMKMEGSRLILKAEDSKEAKARRKQGTWKSLFSSEGLKNAGSSGCTAGFKVSAPSAMNLLADNGSGIIKISDISGDVEADNGSGHIILENLSGNVKVDNGSGGISGAACAKNIKAETGSGGIDLKKLCGPVLADAGSGDISLSWEKTPSSGEARAAAGSGDILMIFPVSAGINAVLDSGSGHIANEFSGGVFPVFADTGSGNISVLKAK